MGKSSDGLRYPAYSHILDMIMSRQLMPGDKIPEVKIAQEFGISRTPVRDAMRQLANEGLIQIYPNRFAKVAEYGESSIRDIGVLRIALDSMAIKLSAMFGSQADFLKLRQIAQDCHDAMAAGDQNRRWSCDSDFHMELANISGNELLVKFQKELYMRVRFILMHHSSHLEDEEGHLRQHFEIVDALSEHDERTAMAVVEDHLTSFYNLKEKFPPQFFPAFSIPGAALGDAPKNGRKDSAYPKAQ